MTRASTWLNDDGLSVPFGTSDGVQDEAATMHTKGAIKQMVLEVDASNLPGYGVPQGDNNKLPAGCTLLSAKFISTETFDNAVEVGTKIAAGTVSDKDGLIGTNVFTANTAVAGAGAQLNTTLSVDLWITVVATTTAATTGAGTLIVEYYI